MITLPGYSDHNLQHISTMNHANSSQVLGHASSSHAHGGHVRRSGENSGNVNLSYDTFNNSASSMDMSQTGNSTSYSMTNLDLGGQVLEPIGGQTNNPGDILLQPNMEVCKSFFFQKGVFL